MAVDLLVDIADIISEPVAGSVSIRPAGGQTLYRTDGQIIAAVNATETLGTGGTPTTVLFPGVPTSDDTDLREDSRGYALEVTAHLKRAERRQGNVTPTTLRWIVLVEGSGTVELSALAQAEGLPRGWVTVAEMEALLTELEATVTQAAADAADAAARAGVYYDGDGDAIPFVFVASDADPGQTKTINGEVYEVWWAQTSPPDPSQWVPKPVTQDVTARSYTVPTDPGATYTVDGVLRSPGTYAVGTSAVTLAWEATAKSGYTFKSGATTSGSMVFAAKTYGPGDVLLSDSFAREGVLAGSTTDSFEGGEPLVWQNATTSGSTIRTQGGAAVGVRATTSVAVFSFDDIVLQSPLDRLDIYVTAKVVDPNVTYNTETAIYLRHGSTQIAKLEFQGGMVMYQPSAQGFPAPASTVVGDALRFEYRSGQVLKCHNITKGTTSTYTGSYVPTASPVDTIRFDSRPPNSTAIGATPRVAVDSLKVVVQ